MSARILIIEDEPAIRELIQVNLSHAGFEVVTAEYASEGKREIDYRLPDLILLDWMLPDFSGVELAKQLRQDIRTKKLPIIMLTARAEEFDKLAGFDAGADDYITKPFSPRELLARVKALLRRTAPEASGVPITMIGLDVTHHAYVDRSVLPRLAALPGASARVATGVSPRERSSLIRAPTAVPTVRAR